MNIIRTATAAALLAITCTALISLVSASPEMTTYYFGDVVTLQGNSYGNPRVYLFVTGPNLPVNGVALDDITKRADQGQFTRVDVDSNDHWVYKWNTASVGGRLDAGTYTVWAVNGPNDLSRLAQADYHTISITFGNPYIVADTPSQPGELSLQSVPDGASLMVNGEYRGRTPLTVSGLTPGTYSVTFTRSGYMEFSTPVSIEAGKTTEVFATLFPQAGTLAVNTSPAGARILLDNTGAGISPVILTNITAGNHTITAEKEGFVTVRQQVWIIAGQTVPATITLGAAPPVVIPTIRAEGLVPATLLASVAFVLLGVMRRPYRR